MKFHHAFRGFTIIEVVLFLAITGILFMGITAATQNSIYLQRYTDSVENFTEFLRSVYSQVPNVQSESTGRSDQVIYGKLVTFDIKDGTDGKRNDIKTYNLIGDIKEKDPSEQPDCSGASGVLARLCRLNATVVATTETYTGATTTNTTGFIEDYIMRWSAGLQTKAGWPGDTGRTGDRPRDFVGILLVTRSPESGNVFTYFMRPNIEDRIENPEDSNANFNHGDYTTRRRLIQDIITNIEHKDQNALICSSSGGSRVHCFTDENFDTKDIDFCINPGGLDARIDLRRNIRISGGNHNASGVQVVTDEPYRDNFQEGNRCKS